MLSTLFLKVRYYRKTYKMLKSEFPEVPKKVIKAAMCENPKHSAYFSSEYFWNGRLEVCKHPKHGAGV